MIDVPLSSAAYYVSFFEKDAAKMLVRTLIQDESILDDIDACLVTSLDFTSDIEACAELEYSSKSVLNNIMNLTDEIHNNIKFNPIYLPGTLDLYEVAELDDNGNIVSISGFQSPYVVMASNFSYEENDDIIQSKVIYKEFETPNLFSTVFSKEKKVLS